MKGYIFPLIIITLCYAQSTGFAIYGAGENIQNNDPASLSLGNSLFFSGDSKNISTGSSSSLWRSALTQFSIHSGINILKSKQFPDQFYHNLTSFSLHFPVGNKKVFGFGLPEPGVTFLFLTLGLATLLSGILLKRKGGGMMLSKDGSHTGARKFLGPAERHLGNDFSVGQLRRALMLDAFEDPFQVNSGGDMDGYSVGRVCHYCSGAGCDQCGNTGEM